MAKKSTSKAQPAKKRQQGLNLYHIVSKVKSGSNKDLYDILAFGKDPQDAFTRVMAFLERTKKAGVMKGQQFTINPVEVEDELVFMMRRMEDLRDED